jgi:hypothetical protein
MVTSLRDGTCHTLGEGVAVSPLVVWSDEGTSLRDADGMVRDDFCSSPVRWSEGTAELAGPGQRIWSLRAGQPRSIRFPQGVFVPPERTSHPWLQFDDEGGAWSLMAQEFTPERVGQGLALMADVWRVGDIVRGIDHRGSHMVWDGGSWRQSASHAGTSTVRHARVRGEWSRWVRHGVRFEGHVFAWSRDGMLVRLPDDALS